MPIAGLWFLDWKAASMLVVYYVDTMVWIGGAWLLAHLEEEDPADDTAKVIIGICGVGVLFGFPVVMSTWGHLEFDRELAIACLVQAGFSAQSLVAARRKLEHSLRVEFSERRRVAARREMSSRLVTPVGRWIAIFMLAAISPVAMVVAYLVATVVFEVLRPDIRLSG